MFHPCDRGVYFICHGPIYLLLFQMSLRILGHGFPIGLPLETVESATAGNAPYRLVSNAQGESVEGPSGHGSLQSHCHHVSVSFLE